MTTQIVLVPGFWLGAWAWDEVAPLLVERDFAVRALTLPGLEADSTDRATVTLDDHANAIVEALDADADQRVLVVHSGAALPGTMVLDRHPDLIDHVVFVDTAPVRDGFAMNADVKGDEYPLSAAWDDEVEQGAMRDLDGDQLRTFESRAVPQPIQTVSGAVSLSDPRRLDIPATVIATTFPADDFRKYAASGEAAFLEGLLDHTAVEYVDIPTGHWPMWSEPGRLAAAIAAAAGWVEVDNPPATEAADGDEEVETDEAN